MNKVLLSFLILILLFLLTGLMLPRTVHVERQIFIDRPVSTVFTLLLLPCFLRMGEHSRARLPQPHHPEPGHPESKTLASAA